jgi:hypothetical protein
MARQIRAKKLRPMLQFAEEELVLPTGPFEGHRYRADRNPFGAHWLNAVDSGLWRRFFFTGVQQAGKTWHGSVIPVIYHLFEVGETVIFGLPSLDMVSDKWNEDLKPAIERTQFKDLLPRSGPGSRGGNVRRITFGNGATLRFMTGGGRDKTRAGYTARVCVTTEVDGMDEAGSTSRETDKIAQLEGRTSAFGDHARFYGECTVSIDMGRTWREYTGGTESKLAIRCQHCRQFVTPEREHLVGWQDAADVDAAAEKASLVCPGVARRGPKRSASLPIATAGCCTAARRSTTPARSPARRPGRTRWGFDSTPRTICWCRSPSSLSANGKPLAIPTRSWPSVKCGSSCGRSPARSRRSISASSTGS